MSKKTRFARKFEEYASEFIKQSEKTERNEWYDTEQNLRCEILNDFTDFINKISSEKIEKIEETILYDNQEKLFFIELKNNEKFLVEACNESEAKYQFRFLGLGDGSGYWGIGIRTIRLATPEDILCVRRTTDIERIRNEKN